MTAQTSGPDHPGHWLPAWPTRRRRRSSGVAVTGDHPRTDRGGTSAATAAPCLPWGTMYGMRQLRCGLQPDAPRRNGSWLTGTAVSTYRSDVHCGRIGAATSPDLRVLSSEGPRSEAIAPSRTGLGREPGVSSARNRSREPFSDGKQGISGRRPVCSRRPPAHLGRAELSPLSFREGGRSGRRRSGPAVALAPVDA